MAFEEVKFEPLRSRPQIKADELSFRCGVKKQYLRFNQELTKELQNKDYKYVALEWDRETNEIRLKFRKYDEGIKLGTSNKGKNFVINHGQFCRFIKDKLGIKEETIKLHISEDKSNVLSVQTRYITL